MTYAQFSLFKSCNGFTGKWIGYVHTQYQSNDTYVSSIAAERLMRNMFSEIPLSKQ